MTLLAALLLLAVAAANGQSSYERIYGYLPYSQVTDHNAIDLDQARSREGLTATVHHWSPNSSSSLEPLSSAAKK